MRRCRWPATIPEAGAAAAPTCRRRGRDPGPDDPAGPRCERRSPCPRRGEGTGLSTRRPVITRYSNNARTAATRRFTVDAAAEPPGPDPRRQPGSAAHPLPIDPVEHQRRIDDGQSEIAFGQEPRQVHHVECIRAHRGRAEPAPAQVRQERIRRIQPVPVAVDPIPAIDLTHPHRHHPSRLPVRACPQQHPPALGDRSGSHAATRPCLPRAG